MSVLKLFLSIIFIVNISTQFLNADARYMTEWTNPDGTKSKSPATFYSIKEAKTQSTPKLLSWECGTTDKIKWINWEIDFKKNELRSWWQNHDTDDFKWSTVDKILSVKDGIITAQDHLKNGKRVDKDKVVTWQLNYQSDNLYSIWKGNKFYYNNCKNTTNYNVPQTASILTWECGPSEYIKWINWELDLEKNELRSKWLNKNSNNQDTQVARIISKGDRSIFVQDYSEEQKKWNSESWEFNYKSDQLYTIFIGEKYNYGDCKNTTNYNVPQTASILTWECGPSEYIKWINWELDLEKNELKSRWENKNSIKERSSIAQIKSSKDGIVTVQDDMLDGNKATTNDIWDFHYKEKDQLYTVWKGKKWFYGDCKSSTPIQTASTPQPAVRQIGHYANDKRNRFIGSYKDGGASFEGYWVQDKSGQECNSLVDGSRFYGKAWFKMVSEGKFEGRWGYCDTAPIFAWNGHQVSFTSDVTKTLSSKQQRVKIQKSLNFFGFNAGSPDGVFGKKTRSAVGDLQSCWSSLDPSGGTLPASTEFGVLTPKQSQFLMDSFDKAKQQYSKANCFYFATLL